MIKLDRRLERRMSEWNGETHLFHISMTTVYGRLHVQIRCADTGQVVNTAPFPVSRDDKQGCMFGFRGLGYCIHPSDREVINEWGGRLLADMFDGRIETVTED